MDIDFSQWHLAAGIAFTFNGTINMLQGYLSAYSADI